MGSNDAPYTPSPWGMEYHALTYDEVLGGGTAGPGKSWALLMDPMKQIGLENDRMRLDRGHRLWLPRGGSIGHALLLRRTFPRISLLISRSQRVFPQIDPGARWYASDKLWEFSSGYKYQFGHCDKTDDWNNYWGLEYTWVGFDELVEFEEVQYTSIILRLRTGDPGLRTMMGARATSNPVIVQQQGGAVEVKDPNWVRTRFVSPSRRGRTVIKQRINNLDGTFSHYNKLFYLPATIDDNPDPQVREDYRRRLLGAKAHIRRALLEGDWFVTAGSYYAEDWVERLHVTRPFLIPDDWKLSRSMDWGFKKPGCIHWWAEDPDGNLFCIRELWFQGKICTEVAKMVEEAEKGPQLRCWKQGRSQITGPADTQLWEQRGDSGKTKAEDFAEMGVMWVPADKKDRTRNAELLTARLRDHEHGTVTPGIVFFDSCKHAIDTIPQIQSDQHNPEAPADGGEDHAHDSILYECAYVSRKGRGACRLDWLDKEDDDDEPQFEEDRGAYGYG